MRTYLKSLLILMLTAANVHAADMGSQLKLKDDSKQELKEIMKQIKKIADYQYEWYSDGHKFTADQKLDFSGCKIKQSFISGNFNSRHEFSLSDIDSAELNTHKSSGTLEVVLKTKDFEKKIFWDSTGIDNNRDKQYVDEAQFTVSKTNSTLLLVLFEKTIKLCADR